MKNLLILFIFFYSVVATAESVAINNDGTTAAASAVLDLKSTTKGFLPPRMTIAERDAIDSPATGLLIWCTNCGTTGAIKTYNGAVWTSISIAGTVFYEDTDGDGYGDINSSVVAESKPTGYLSDNKDCDDSNLAINPGVTEACDGIDNNCDGSIDEGFTVTMYYRDLDKDGYGNNFNDPISVCYNPGVGYSLTNDDCDDYNNKSNPAATEICDGKDNDCDGLIDEDLIWTTYYVDTDRDGYGDSNDATGNLYCSNPGIGYSLTNDDCSNLNAQVSPGTMEDNSDGIDNNCDGQIDELSIGQYLNGGIVFYLAPTPTDLNGDGVLDTGLVCAIENQIARQWDNSTVFTNRNVSSSIGSGSSNTNKIGGVSSSCAAASAKIYNGGGFNDWFLPSIDELMEMFKYKDFIDTTSVKNGGAALLKGYTWSSSQGESTSDGYFRPLAINFGACTTCYVTYEKNPRNAYYNRAVRAF